MKPSTRVVNNSIDLSEFEDGFRPGPGCSAGFALERLDDLQRAKVYAAVAARKPFRVVAARLSEWSGVDTREASLRRHIREECRCG